MTVLATPIALRGLAYRTDDGTAVAGLTLEVDAGTLVALVGPGADDALAILATTRSADAGEALVAGRPLGAHPHPARVVGVAPAHGTLAPGRTLGDHLRLCARLAGAPAWCVDAAAARAGLSGADLRERPSDVDGVLRRRAALAGALVGSPAAVVLPAPFDRLRDAAEIRELGTLLRQEAAAGLAVLCSCADPRVGAAVAHTAIAPAPASRPDVPAAA